MARQKNTKLYQRNQDFDCKQQDDKFIYSAKAVTMMLPVPCISLDNACVAVSAVLASGLNISQQAIAEGLSAVRLAGRFDIRELNERLWVFDVAHNEAGVRFLLGQFVPFWQDKFTPTKELHIVFSMLADKDIESVLNIIKQSQLPIKTWHIAPLDNSRTMTAQAIFDHLSRVFVEPCIYHYESMAMATQGVMNASQIGDVVLVFGSFHTIGESLIALGEYANPVQF